MTPQQTFDVLHIVISEDDNADLVAELALDILDALETAYTTTTDKQTIENALTQHELTEKAKQLSGQHD